MNTVHSKMALAAILCQAILGSCWLAKTYVVVPQSPQYLLRSPDSRDTPFQDVLREYNGFARGGPSIDLRPQMQIRVENAYYEKGASRKGLKGYLGTEIARYEVGASGLLLLSVVPMSGRPEGDRPVQDLISTAQLKFHFYRLYFEILFNRKTDSHGSVLLGAQKLADLDHLSADLAADPEAACRKSTERCTVFPEACSVSVEMKIVVNARAQTITWGSLLSSIVTAPPKQLRMQRLSGRRLVGVKLDLRDQNQLRLPLLPDDHIEWK